MFPTQHPSEGNQGSPTEEAETSGAGGVEEGRPANAGVVAVCSGGHCVAPNVVSAAAAAAAAARHPPLFGSWPLANFEDGSNWWVGAGMAGLGSGVGPAAGGVFGRFGPSASTTPDAERYSQGSRGALDRSALLGMEGVGVGGVGGVVSSMPPSRLSPAPLAVFPSAYPGMESSGGGRQTPQHGLLEVPGLGAAGLGGVDTQTATTAGASAAAASPGGTPALMAADNNLANARPVPQQGQQLHQPQPQPQHQLQQRLQQHFLQQQWFLQLLPKEQLQHLQQPHLQQPQLQQPQLQLHQPHQHQHNQPHQLLKPQPWKRKASSEEGPGSWASGGIDDSESRADDSALTPQQRLERNRVRNRDHSRRSRQRKKALVEVMKSQVAELGVYRMLMEQAHDMISAHTPDDRALFLHASSAFNRLLGIDAKELLGVPLLEMVHPDYAEKLNEVIRRAVLSNGGVQVVSYRLRYREREHGVETSFRAVSGRLLAVTRIYGPGDASSAAPA